VPTDAVPADAPDDAVLPADAVLLIGFGGPEGPAQVLPFLRRVTAGKGIPDERLAEVGKHYEHFGGVSPINEFHRQLQRRWAADLQRRWPGLPLYLANRNTEPFLPDVLARMRDDGVARAVAVATSAFSSYSGCRQYRQDVATAAEQVPGAPWTTKAHPFFDHPLMVRMWADRVRDGLARLPGARRPLVLFATHSIPQAAADRSGPGGTGAYPRQHRELAAAVMAAALAQAPARDVAWDLCYQSRSGPPQQPWLEPDVSDRLATARDQEARDAVVIVPLGFVSDHIEVLWDLDEVALADAARLGLAAVRVETIGTDDRFLTVLSDLVAQYRDGTPFPSVRTAGALPHCPLDCCLPVRRPAAASGTVGA
jgi:ferrochelatase